MKLYRIQATKTLSTIIFVKAESEDEAHDKAYNFAEQADNWHTGGLDIDVDCEVKSEEDIFKGEKYLPVEESGLTVEAYIKLYRSSNEREGRK
jgi:hypothetical protein